MEKIKQKILSFTKIPLNVLFPIQIEEKKKEEYINIINKNSYFALKDENSNFCGMLAPITLIIGYSLSETTNTYILSADASADDFKKYLDEIFETETQKNLKSKEKRFFDIFKKPTESSTKNEADSLFLTQNYLKAYEKYSGSSNLFDNLHFQEMKCYSSILLNEKLDLSFIFNRSFINQPIQLRVLHILLDLSQINDRYLFKIVQSISLMDACKEKYTFIERLFCFEITFASHLYFEYLNYIVNTNETSKVDHFFNIFDKLLQKRSNFLSEKIKKTYDNLKERYACVITSHK